MESLGNLIGGFETALTLSNLGFCFLGVLVGMLVGVLPGVGPAAGTAIVLPLTFGLDPVAALIMLSGIYYGAQYGGTITSILLNVPGEASSVVTMLDGHPLARRGRAGVALGIAAIGSFIGGTVATIAMTLMSEPLAQFSLKFGSPERFALMLFGMTMVSGFAGRSFLRATIATLLGLALALPGLDPVSGASRYTFGNINLLNGLDLVAVAMGLFGIGEVLYSLEQGNVKVMKGRLGSLFPSREEWKPVLASILRGTGLGFLVGIVPGIGPAISSFMSYSVEKRLSKHPERFGQGALEGVAGPETANNATATANLIPLLTLGLPGSATVAIMMGAFLMNGITPGPLLFVQQADLVWALIASFYVGNLMLVALNLPLAGLWARLLYIPYRYLFPVIIILAVIGVYSVNGNPFDVLVMAVAGVVGYLARKLDIPLAATILAFVLGPLAETALVQSLQMSRGSVEIFVTRPITLLFLLLTVAVIVVAVVGGVRRLAASNDGE